MIQAQALAGGFMANTMASGIGESFSSGAYYPDPPMSPEDYIAKTRAMEVERRRAMPIHLNVTEAKGGWIISGNNPFEPIDRQIVATSIDEVLTLMRGLMTRDA